jgi:NAD(P)-dependent dehydrogenase (short-subunit alcohol dehydrogenase family)
MQRLKGKRALITGGNSGIGRGIVRRFLNEGANVVFNGRDEAKGQDTLAEMRDLNANAAFHAADLSDVDQAKALVEFAVRHMGSLDIVVNNAGFGGFRSSIDKDDGPKKRWDHLRGGNLDSGYFVSSFAFPHLAESGKGAIVNTTSTATWHGNWGLYCMAKAGVEGMVRAMANEGADYKVRVNGVSPGWIDTAVQDDAIDARPGPTESWAGDVSLIDNGRMGTPREIASAALFLASDEASFITGQTLIVDGGLMTIDYPSREMLKENGWKLKSR